MGSKSTEVIWGLWKVLNNSEEMGFILQSKGKPRKDLRRRLRTLSSALAVG